MAERRIQDILDANTDRIPESLYIELSNEVMRVHNRVSDRSMQSILNALHSDIFTLQLELQIESDRTSSLRRQLEEARSGVELARLREELELRKNINADTVIMYKGQITAQCAKIVEYKSKIRELNKKLESNVPVKATNTCVMPTTIPTPTPKPPNIWITHVRLWAVEHNTTYTEALKSRECNDAYWAVKRQNALNHT